MYRHSFLAEYVIIDLKTKEVYELAQADIRIPRQIQLVTWTPNANSIMFVYDNNIYYKNEAISDDIVQVSTDGVPQKIYNGVPDWVYEGEN